MIGWITLSHSYRGDCPETDEINSIGVYVEPAAGDKCGAAMKMECARTYEIEAAFLAAFGDDRFDDVQWWTADPHTWAHIVNQMPHMAIRIGHLLSSAGLMDVVGYLTTAEHLRPLEQTMADYELFCAVRGAIDSCAGDLNRIIERNLG